MKQSNKLTTWESCCAMYFLFASRDALSIYPFPPAACPGRTIYMDHIHRFTYSLAPRWNFLMRNPGRNAGWGEESEVRICIPVVSPLQCHRGWLLPSANGHTTSPYKGSTNHGPWAKSNLPPVFSGPVSCTHF